MPEMPVETDNEQDEQSDPVQMFLRAARGGGDDGGSSDPYTRAASGPRITPMSAPAPDVTPSNAQPAAPSPAVNPAAAMGKGFIQPSDAARSLGEFADATGSEPTPPFTAPAGPPVPDAATPQIPASLFPGTTGAPQLQKTHLEQVAPPPQPPTMDPAYAKTQEDLRAHSAVTPKYDPETGKTLDQYKPSFGSRLGRAFLDAGEGFLHGGIRGAVAAPLAGAFGNKDAPGYFGRGAVNSKYFKDETARKNTVAADTAKVGSFEDQNKQAQQEFKDKNEVYKDTMGQAYKQDLNEIKQQGADEKAKQDKAMDELRGAANDLKDQLRSITYDPQKKQFMRGDQVYTPKDFQEGAVLETQHGIQNGPYTQKWMQERKNQPTIHMPKTPSEFETWRETFKEENGRYPTAREIVSRKALPKDRAGLLKSIEKEKDDAIGKVQAQFNKDFAKAQADKDKNRQDELTKNLDRDKSRIQGGYEAKLQTIPEERGDQADPPSAPKLTPIPDKQMKSPGGRVYKVGDAVPDGKGGQNTIKGFAKSTDGKVHATF